MFRSLLICLAALILAPAALAQPVEPEGIDRGACNYQNVDYIVPDGWAFWGCRPDNQWHYLGNLEVQNDEPEPTVEFSFCFDTPAGTICVAYTQGFQVVMGPFTVVPR